MVSTSKVAASAAAGIALIALVSYGSAPALYSGVKARSSPMAAQLSRTSPAMMAKVGKAVTELLGPNASPKDFRNLANEVACTQAINTDNLFLKNAACANIEWYGTNRQKWFPGKDAPAHLKGELAGDFGFDPFGWGVEDLQARADEELYHARWAMLGAMGILTTDVLSKMGVAIEPKWWNVGQELLQGKPIDYLGNPGFVHASNFGAIFAVQFFLMASAEVYRGYYETEEGSKGMYPGGAFDPLGFAKNPKKFEELKIKEIKNGRIAMLAMLGFYSQAFSTGKTPLDNLGDHLSNPFVNHI